MLTTQYRQKITKTQVFEPKFKTGNFDHNWIIKNSLNKN